MALVLAVVLAPGANASSLDKLAGGLDELARGSHPWAHQPGPSVAPVAGIVRDGRVLVDVYVSGVVRNGAATLRAKGMHVEALSARAPQRMVEGWLPLSALDDVAALDGTRVVVPVYPGILNTGGTLSEGDAAHRGPQARALGPTGAGTPVGIVSDTINKRGSGVAGSQSTGEIRRLIS